ncbi:MAG: hypothetical protein JWQ66_2137 [Mucilaginibacter sp.]|nr:hypothetical protein [Mucilaginibacter sp.]
MARWILTIQIAGKFFLFLGSQPISGRADKMLNGRNEFKIENFERCINFDPMPRDDFKKPTLDAMAKRVGYFCSNPNCEKPTVGPNSQPDGVLLIGVGAHITAASAGGPRFDNLMSVADRSSIGNGIWLCASCSVMIDKDVMGFPVNLLHNWKRGAEENARSRMQGKNAESTGRPYIEVDLIWAGSGRANHGLSDKNPLTKREGIFVYEVGPKPIIYWALDWNYRLVIYNNSSLPAYNLAVSSVGTIHFDELTKLPKKNNLTALENLDLTARLEDELEGDYTQADAMIVQKFPKRLDNLKLEFTYQNENRSTFKTLAHIVDGEINNAFY